MPYTLIYVRSEHEVLLVKKPAYEWGNPARWLGLGGKVEPDEDLHAAAILEAEEESGRRETISCSSVCPPILPVVVRVPDCYAVQLPQTHPAPVGWRLVDVSVH